MQYLNILLYYIYYYLLARRSLIHFFHHFYVYIFEPFYKPVFALGLANEKVDFIEEKESVSKRIIFKNSIVLNKKKKFLI